MIEVWFLTLIVAPTSYMGTSARPGDALVLRLQTREQCEDVRSFLKRLDTLVPESLHVGDCTRVLKDDPP